MGLAAALLMLFGSLALVGVGLLVLFIDHRLNPGKNQERR